VDALPEDVRCPFGDYRDRQRTVIAGAGAGAAYESDGDKDEALWLHVCVMVIAHGRKAGKR
jgi:hypothetical protein